MFAAFGLAQSDGIRGLCDQQTVKQATVGRDSDVFCELRIDAAIRVQNVVQQRITRTGARVADVGTDVVADAADAVTLAARFLEHGRTACHVSFHIEGFCVLIGHFLAICRYGAAEKLNRRGANGFIRMLQQD